MGDTRLVSVRLPVDLADWADGYGAERRWPRSTVIVAALEALREDSRGGVPELPGAVARAGEQAERSVPVPEPRRRQLQHGDRVPARPPVPAVPGVKRGSEVKQPETPLPRIAKWRER